MNFKISKKEFLDSLQLSAKAVSSTTPLPVLSGVKLVCEENKLEMYSSDSNISIKTVINNEYNVLEISETGEIVIDARYLVEIIRKVDSEYINFEIIDGTLIKIYGGTSEFKINGIQASEYPNISFNINSIPFKMNAKELIEDVTQTIFACSDKETRPVLTGVNFKTNEGKLIVNATDSYRLAYKVRDFKEDAEFNITIPAKYLLEVVRSIGNEDEIQIAVDSQQIFFLFKNTIIKTRLLDDAFPETTRLIPQSFTQILKVDSREFLNQLDRTSFIKGDGKTVVRLTINEKNVDLNTADSISSFHGRVSTVGFEGNAFEISCSIKYLIDAIKAISTDVITICFSGELKPMILKKDDDPNLIQLISPVRTYR